MEMKMKTNNQQVNYKALIGAGIAFIGAGITFMIAVNPMIGVGLISVGVVFVIVGARKRKE
jgi:hypothetical protein